MTEGEGTALGDDEERFVSYLCNNIGKEARTVSFKRSGLAAFSARFR
jgi:hypothetical protein